MKLMNQRNNSWLVNKHVAVGQGRELLQSSENFERHDVPLFVVFVSCFLPVQ